MRAYSLGAPALYDAGEIYLLNVVGDDRPNTEDRATIVSVGTEHDLRGCHTWAERLEDVPNGLVGNHLLESPKLFVVLMFALHWRVLRSVLSFEYVSVRRTFGNG